VFQEIAAMQPNDRSRASLTVLCLLVLSVLALTAIPSYADSLLIRGGTLIDGTGGPPRRDVRILIEGNLIKDVWTGEAAGKQWPPDARIIDAADRFIIPGLIDSHVHYREYMGELFLSHGVTTVFDLGNPFYWQRAVQEGLNDGTFYGPRFYFCGSPTLPSATEEGRPSISRRSDVFGIMRAPGDATAIVKAVKEHSDCLKLSEDFPGELFSPLAREAKASKLTTISHSLQAVDSANWGITGIEHMTGVAIATIRAPAGQKALAALHIEAGHKNSFLYQWMQPEYFDEVIKHLIGRGVFINPTLAFEWKALTDRVASHELEDTRLLYRPELQHVPLDERLLTLGQYHWPDRHSDAEKEQFMKGYRKVQDFLGRFVRAGGKIYAGTDSAAATTPGLSLHHELELLVDAGLSPMDALMTATRNGAELLGMDQIGTIKAGTLADLVILSRDPLQNIQNSKSIELVIKDGKVVDLKYDPAHMLPIGHPGPITKHLYHPVPNLGDVVPPVARKSASLKLRLSGRGFVQSSMVMLETSPLKTSWISATELEAELPTTLTTQIGTYAITVRNPKPGGGTSNEVPFIISGR
jgi:hypothetical protein